MVNIPLNVQQTTLMYYLRSILMGLSEGREFLEYEERATLMFSVIFTVVVTMVFLILGSISISRKDIH